MGFCKDSEKFMSKKIKPFKLFKIFKLEHNDNMVCFFVTVTCYICEEDSRLLRFSNESTF